MKVGDVVVLKSGGPKMTVTAVNSSAVECIWFTPDTWMRPTTQEVERVFNYHSGQQSGNFPSAALILADMPV